MIKKYIDYINESLSLILESDVVYSSNFRKALSKIDHPLAKKILEIENKDYPVQSNYFDLVKDKNDTVSFIPDRRAKEMESTRKELFRFRGEGGWLTHNMKENGTLFDMLGYVPSGSPYEPRSNDVGEIVKKVTSPTSGRVYAWVKFVNGNQGVYNQNTLVPAESENEVWTRNRQEVKVGRAIRSLLNVSGEKFADKDIESFVNMYKSTIDKLNDKFSNFEIVKGEDIAYWYNSKNYYSSNGNLGASCMANVPSSYLEIYTNNPDIINLVIYKHPDNSEKIIGRALLWKLKDGKLFMDRIYTNQDSDVELFRQYAKDNGIYYKRINNSSSSNQCVAPNGDFVNLDLNITLKSVDYDEYPYLDTLKFYFPGTGKISNESSKGALQLEETGGGHMTSCDECDGNGRVTCYNCDGDGNFECYNCEGSGTDDCDDCSGSGENTCDGCNGTGKNNDGSECNKCNGSTKTKCTGCDGSGKVDCSRCDGDGTISCDECDGNGSQDCPECG